MQTRRQMAGTRHQWSGLPASTLADGVTDYGSPPQNPSRPRALDSYHHHSVLPAVCALKPRPCISLLLGLVVSTWSSLISFI